MHVLDFSGRSVIVTGAAAGIGRATAHAFAAAGANVTMADIDEARLVEAANLIGLRTGATCLPAPTNVASDGDCARLAATARDAFGRIDALVNNAGIVSPGTILDLDPVEWDRVMDINLRSVFVLTQTVARAMIEDGVRGAIVNVSSVNAELAIPNQLAYVASKGGVQQFTKAAALGLAPHGIRVNAVGPGSIMTDLLKAVADDGTARARILSRTPMGRIGAPEEVANVILFLASDLASYMTGETVFVDGGRRALNYTVPVVDA